MNKFVAKRVSRNKALIIIAITVLFIFLLSICLPIKVKQAIDIEIANNDTILDIDSLVGTQVTLLCDPSSREVTAPSDNEFAIIAILNESGIFEPLPTIGDDGMFIAVPGIYVYPKHFIGDAIKNYNYGFRNQFVFRGMLSCVTEEKWNNRPNSYSINLDSWDIVYPVHHWEFYFGPDNNFYRRHLFLFDYLIT